MSLITSIKKYKKRIGNFLFSYLTYQTRINQSSDLFAKEGLKKILDFTQAGKCLRGCLFFFLYQQLGGKDEESALKMASALELIHSGLLIHDDIIDNDQLRRTQPTIFFQYQKLSETSDICHLLGKSLAICLGDVCFFLAFKLIGEAFTHNPLKEKIIANLAEEITMVGFAQMDDVFFSQTKKDPSLELITNIYRFKTARYTFYLPIFLAINTSGRYTNEIPLLEQYAESTGMIFQITDDLINLFSSETISGKTAYSDIAQNKKTIIRYLMFRSAGVEDQIKLRKIFGQKTITQKNLAEFKSLFSQLKIGNLLNNIINSYRQKAIASIKKTSLPRKLKQNLIFLVDYLIRRKK